jgi:formylglycine-generating enzyme required for sulfatase activity
VVDGGRLVVVDGGEFTVGLRRGDGEREREREREREGKIWGENGFWGQKMGIEEEDALRFFKIRYLLLLFSFFF